MTFNQIEELASRKRLPSVPPVPVISPTLALRINARVLDPTTAPVAPGRPTPRPTVYLADSLLLAASSATEFEQTFSSLQGHARKNGIEATLVPLGRSARKNATALRVSLTRAQDWAESAAPIDAWAYLQRAIADGVVPVRMNDQLGRPTPTVTIEHVLTATSGILGGTSGAWGGTSGAWGGTSGAWGGTSGAWGGTGLSEYGSPGLGGRTPVTWCGRNPREDMTKAERPPVVAILDTGIGQHPWFPEGDGVHRAVTYRGERIGLFHAPEADPEVASSILDPLNGLVDAFCGHGTFVAGVVRQRCPQAELLAIPVTVSDGAAREGDVIQALQSLLDRHLDAKAGTVHLEDDPKIPAILDFVNLSLGYYNETPPDAQDSLLFQTIQRLTEAGVSVVAAAGNDATSCEFFPAAFTTAVPAIMSVGAENPDGHTVALFSNSGPWVRTHAPGAAIVSTVPTTLSGSHSRSIEVHGFWPAARGTVDVDDYRSGFAIWSGTSFAAPYVVGEAAARLVTHNCGTDRADTVDAISATAAVATELTTELQAP